MNTLHFTELNFYAVFAAWIIHTVSGLLWFQPRLFGNEWSRLTGKELKPAKKWIIPGLVGHLVMVFVLVIIIKMANVDYRFGWFACRTPWLDRFCCSIGDRGINLGKNTLQIIPDPDRESIHWNGYFWFNPGCMAMNYLLNKKTKTIKMLVWQKRHHK